MGQEVSHLSYEEAERAAFRDRLRDETKILKRWFDEGVFEISDPPTTGLEIEAWLLDENHLPAPESESFISAVNDPRVVPELSKFNFELNVDPQKLAQNFLSNIQRDLETLWADCVRATEQLRLRPVSIGILPTVRDEMLQPSWMSNSNRYSAISAELFRQRQKEPLHIHIEGKDTLDYRCDHIMLEAACTSLQAHLSVTPQNAVRLQNASMIAAGPLVAATANSPYLYGRSLWSETRIPAFEQSTMAHGFRDVQGRNTLRVTFGTGYLRHSFLELFLENLSYPALLPALDNNADQLFHLRLQNGTIWRWNRPIVGFNAAGAPHLRIEHRSMPAGPSLTDMIANLALYFGLTLALGSADTPPESQTPFEDARANFYACAKEGLSARVRWAGQTVGVQSLLFEHLLPRAKHELARMGASPSDLDYYFDEILKERLRTGRTGATWQNSFIACHGENFQALTEAYVAQQATGAPVHLWTV